MDSESNTQLDIFIVFQQQEEARARKKQKFHQDLFDLIKFKRLILYFIISNNLFF
jgi:hypothetical protein